MSGYSDQSNVRIKSPFHNSEWKRRSVNIFHAKTDIRHHAMLQSYMAKPKLSSCAGCISDYFGTQPKCPRMHSCVQNYSVGMRAFQNDGCVKALCLCFVFWSTCCSGLLTFYIHGTQLLQSQGQTWTYNYEIAQQIYKRIWSSHLYSWLCDAAPDTGCPTDIQSNVNGKQWRHYSGNSCSNVHVHKAQNCPLSQPSRMANIIRHTYESSTKSLCSLFPSLLIHSVQNNFANGACQVTYQRCPVNPSQAKHSSDRNTKMALLTPWYTKYKNILCMIAKYLCCEHIRVFVSMNSISDEHCEHRDAITTCYLEKTWKCCSSHPTNAILLIFIWDLIVKGHLHSYGICWRLYILYLNPPVDISCSVAVDSKLLCCWFEFWHGFCLWVVIWPELEIWIWTASISIIVESAESSFESTSPGHRRRMHAKRVYTCIPTQCIGADYFATKQEMNKLTTLLLL